MNEPATGGGAHVFVYGTLMQGLALHRHLAGAAFVARATARGRLYDCGSYPAMTPGDGVVRGEVYALEDVAAGLEVLDEVEDYDPLHPEDSLYLRGQAPVRTDDGAEILAWLYLYNRPIVAAALIRSGDWRRP